MKVRHGVYRPDGVALSGAAQLRAACLSIGAHAVASHRSALWLWNLGDRPNFVELTVPRANRSSQSAMIVHRSTDLSAAQTFIRHGVPVTKPARTLLDAAGVVRPADLEEAVEEAFIRRLVSVAGLRNILDECGRRGRKGAGKLRDYLDARALGDERAESHLEPVMARLMRDHGVGPVLFQSTVVLDGKTYRPDFQIPGVRLAVEVDGLDAHRGRAAFDNDITRQNAFTRHGWQVLRYSSTHLRKPACVAREIINVANDRRQLLERSA